MRVVRALVRFLKLAGYFVWFGLELAIRRPATRQARADWLHRFCKTVLRAFELKLTVEGTAPARGALISNHLSYLDIIVFAALEPCVFCSKAEIEHWPVLGWFATMSGTVFVERGKGGSAARASVGMKAAAEAGLPVVFFPEGTTTNGKELLPFHSGLLAQALEAQEPVTPAFLRYTLDVDNGLGVSVENDVCYWGDEVTLLPHVFRFLGLNGVHAHVRMGEGGIRFADETDRKAAAEEAHAAVMALGGGSVTRDAEARSDF